MDDNKSYRIRTNIGSDTVVHFTPTMDVEFLEILSLKLRSTNNYKSATSETGVVVGRVLANGGFGIPNAKVSIFISKDNNEEDALINSLYSYTNAITKNGSKKRYNLLPDSNNTNRNCFQVIGTFPSKRLVIDDSVSLEVFEKYYKLTAVTNQSGDYMIYGVPTGAQTVHVDIDLSDIGVLSQKPIDMIYQGYNINQFNSGSQFKASDDLETLPQVVTQNQNIDVYPFWGDSKKSDISITRCDINVSYEFKPTCVFMGSTITDSSAYAISRTCGMPEGMGRNSNLITNSGTIEMIRKTSDGYVEEFPILGNKLINGDGVFCYQIPMNLDYVMTNEEGKLVPTDKPNKGIATRACVRFRFSLDEMPGDSKKTHRAKYLVPNNPKLVEKNSAGNYVNKIDLDPSRTLDSYYKFGSETNDEDFKNLYWNKVYSVKSYVPRLQKSFLPKTKKYMSLKAVNYADDKTPLPYNNLRVDVTLRFVVLCIIAKIVLYAITLINWIACIFRASDSSDDTDGTMKTCIPFQVDEDSTKIYIPGCRPRRRWDTGQTHCSRYINTLKSFIGQERLVKFGSPAKIAEDGYGIQDGQYSRLYIKDGNEKMAKDGEIIFTSNWGVRICDRAFVKSKNGGGFRYGDKGEDGYSSQKLFDDGVLKVVDGEVQINEEAGDVDTWMLDTTPFDKMNVTLFFNLVKQYILRKPNSRYNTYYGSVMAVWLGTAWIDGWTTYPNKDNYWFRAVPSFRRLFREFGYGWSDVWDILEDYRYMLEWITFEGVYIDIDENGEEVALTSVDNETNYRFGVRVKLDPSMQVEGDRRTFSNITPKIAYYRIHERIDRLYVWSKRNKGVFDLDEVKDLIESTLAEQEEVVKMDFANDWVNGMLYFPMWEMRRTRKRRILGWTFGGRELFCECKDKSYRLKLYNTCASTVNEKDNTPNYRAEIDAGAMVGSNKTTHGEPENRSTALYRLRRYVRLKGGVIKKVQNRDGYNIYYYTIGNIVRGSEGLRHGRTESNFAPLFATDIILLGSLDENDIHGVPQLFDHLSPTSSNIPPMRTEYDVATNPTEDQINEDEDPEDNEDNQFVSMTGIDFSHKYPYSTKATDKTVMYGNGLFTNITCFNAYTITKSCVNARRMSELGVYGDATYGKDTENLPDNIIKYADGFVGYFDVQDQEARTMFATMNFGNLNNNVFDKNTGYISPQFQYLSPFAFNGPGYHEGTEKGAEVGGPNNTDAGSLQWLQSYREASKSLPYYDVDFNDVQYSIFRNGRNTVKPYLLDYTSGSGYGHMPFYQNSFYFFFGLAAGKTAYDDFINTYYSSCPKAEKDAIVFDAYVTYKHEGGGMYYTESGVTRFNMATIHVDISRITEMYSIKIVRKSDNTTVFDADEAVLHSMNLLFEGYFSGNTDSFNVAIPENAEDVQQITDDRYIVTITDGDGGVVKQVVTVERIDTNGTEPGSLSGDELGNGLLYTVQTTELGTMYLPPLTDQVGVEDESKNEIEAGNLQGKLDITMFTLSSDDYTFAKVEVYDADAHIIKATTTGGHTILITMDTINGNTVFNEEDYMTESSENQSQYFKLAKGGAIEFLFYKPCIVGLKFELVVEDAENPVNTGTYTIVNGGCFDGFINDVPAAFVLGNKYDKEASYDEVGMLGTLYDAERCPNTIEGLDAFFHLDSEKTYKFYATDYETSRYHWSRFINDYDTTMATNSSYLTRRELIETAKAKFIYMMNMMAATNMPCKDTVSMATTCSDRSYEKKGHEFKYSTPSQPTDNSMQSCFSPYLSEKETECENVTPHIVGANYCRISKHDVANGKSYSVPVYYDSTLTVPVFNPVYEATGDTCELGTYLAIRDTYEKVIEDETITKDVSMPVLYDNRDETETDSQSDYSYMYEKKYHDQFEEGSELVVKSYPMYKHIAIDRRLDYDLDIVLPVKKSDGTTDESIMHGGYITGAIINGIEMDYDEGRVITGRNVIDSNHDGLPVTQTITIGFNPKFIDDYVQNYTTPYQYVIYKKAGVIYTTLLFNRAMLSVIAKQQGVTIIGTTYSIYNIMKEKIVIYTSQTQFAPPPKVGLYMYYAGPNVAGGEYTYGKFYVGANDSCCNIHWVEIDKSDIYIDIEESFDCTYESVGGDETGIFYEYTLNEDRSSNNTEWVKNNTSLKKRLYEACIETEDGTVYDMRSDMVKSGVTPADGSGSVVFNGQLWSKTKTSKNINVTGNFGKDEQGNWSYPTKRGVASVCMPISNKYVVKFASCSYEPHAVLDDNNLITAKTAMCDENTISIPYDSYFDYSEFKNNAHGTVGNKSRFIVSLKSVGNSVYQPDSIRELIYLNKLNSDQMAHHDVHLKAPYVVQTDATALATQKDTFDEWITSVVRVKNSLNILRSNSGRLLPEKMAFDAPDDGVSNLNGYTAYGESETKNDLITNIASNTSSASPVFNSIKLNSAYPYVFVADERMYVNNTENRLFQRAKVIRVSDIYKLDSVTVGNLSASGNVLSCTITTDKSENRNPLIDIVAVKVYNTVSKKYSDNIEENTYITSTVSGDNKVYTVIVSTQDVIGAGSEMHIITNSGVTYAIGL